ncbi:MAG TPA: hypothetical protein PKX76_09340, partial [Flexilinea sp.]|nr:hypothetical protein [Flexilinea sp.]
SFRQDNPSKFSLFLLEFTNPHPTLSRRARVFKTASPTSRSAVIFFGFTVGDGVPDVPISSIFLSSPFAGIGFCHPNLDNVHGVLQKYRHPFDKTILLNFLFFYWNLPPSPSPLPQGEGFNTFGRISFFFTAISPKGRWFRFPQKLFYAA